MSLEDPLCKIQIAQDLARIRVTKEGLSPRHVAGYFSEAPSTVQKLDWTELMQASPVLTSILSSFLVYLIKK